MKLVAHMTWLASGWPDWVAETLTNEDFDREINAFQSVFSYSMVVVNLIPGALVDFATKMGKNRISRESKGAWTNFYLINNSAFYIKVKKLFHHFLKDNKLP